MEEISFELPKENRRIIDIIKFISGDWDWINADLFATKEMYEKNTILKNSRFVIRKQTEPPFKTEMGFLWIEDKPYEDINWAWPPNVTKEPTIDDMKSIIFKEGMFSSFTFHRAGGKTCFRGMNTPQISRIILNLLEIGYKGRISLYTGYSKYGEIASRESIQIDHYQKIIKLTWNQDNGGSKESLQEIIDKLKSLNLKEIKNEEICDNRGAVHRENNYNKFTR